MAAAGCRDVGGCRLRLSVGMLLMVLDAGSIHCMFVNLGATCVVAEGRNQAEFAATVGRQTAGDCCCGCWCPDWELHNDCPLCVQHGLLAAHLYALWVVKGTWLLAL
jgi:hypothetical protein